MPLGRTAWKETLSARKHAAVLTFFAAAVVALVISGSLPHQRRGELEDYTFTASQTPAEEPGTYTYTATSPASNQLASYTYTGVAPSSDNGGQLYTYTSIPPPSTTTTYTGIAPSDESGKLYTYTSIPPPAAQTTYTATPEQHFMTVINGYVPDPKKNTEKWYTVPVGYLHPTDRAGDWQSGAFDSLNKDGTVAANAPLTLTGSQQRPSFPEPTTARRQRSHAANFMGAKLSAPAAREQELAQLVSEDGSLSKIKAFPEAQQVAWAKRVVEREGRRALERIPTSDVSKLSPAKQREWAEAVTRDAKARRGRAAAARPLKKEWADHVLRLMGAKDVTGTIEKAARQHSKLAAQAASGDTQATAQTASRVGALKTSAASAGGDGRAAVKQVRGGKTASQDAFGMPSLDAAMGWLSGMSQTDEGASRAAPSLASGRGCGPACMKQAQLSADNSIPTD